MLMLLGIGIWLYYAMYILVAFGLAWVLGCIIDAWVGFTLEDDGPNMKVPYIVARMGRGVIAFIVLCFLHLGIMGSACSYYPDNETCQKIFVEEKDKFQME